MNEEKQIDRTIRKQIDYEKRSEIRLFQVNVTYGNVSSRIEKQSNTYGLECVRLGM
jgi:hypothetical protein